MAGLFKWLFPGNPSRADLLACLQAGPPPEPTRHPLNVSGPFYTCGRCLACGAPELEAPQLLAKLDDVNRITHFVRQPATPEEIEHACRAIEVCCVGDLRYGGDDPQILRRLGHDPQLRDGPK